MNISEIIQNVATGSAVTLGIIYIIGGLIVNLNLARRGIVEFQILKIKYLATGIVFITQSIGSLILAMILGIIVITYQVPSAWLQGVNIISLTAAFSLFAAWMRLPPGSKSFFASWWYWLMASVIGATFPAIIFIQHFLKPEPPDVFQAVLAVQAFLTGLLMLLGQIYHYAVFYYGKPQVGYGTLDPIGVGIPSRIRIACTPENSSLLKNLGVNFNKQNVTSDLFLVEETDHDFIVAFEAFPFEGKNTGTLKIDKSLIKAMLYLADTKQE